MKVEIIYRDFEFSHGTRPRGRGGWLFQFSADRSVSTSLRDAPPVEGNAKWTEAMYVGDGPMTFAEARRAAVAGAKMFGYSVIWVCP